MTIDKVSFKKISERIDSYREDCIRLQFGLSAIPALSPENGGDGELPKARFLAERLRELGFTDIFEINAPDSRVSSGQRPNLIARIPGKCTDRMVWIMTHLDIVPPGEASLWHSDPYKGFVKDGLVYGRGTEDNQQDMVASIFAAKAFLDEGLTPRVRHRPSLSSPTKRRRAATASPMSSPTRKIPSARPTSSSSPIRATKRAP